VKATDFKFTFIAVMYITLMLLSNLLAVKIIGFWGLVLTPGVFIYPFSFMFGDILAEVYGFQTARKVIWLGLFVLLIFVAATQFAIHLPYPDFWTGQEAVAYVFSTTPRICLASAIAYLAGSLMNAWALEQIGHHTHGRLLWLRTIGSSIMGELIDTVLFITIAFAGAMPWGAFLVMILCQYLVKVLTEALGGTPLAYLLVRWARS
jgi:uncharacterized integral membrane protein (TIGR00697 family)